MPDLEKILPLIIVALWYIFKGGKKKEQAPAQNEYEEASRKSQPNQAKPKSRPKTNLQDILEELMNEANPEKVVREAFQTEKPTPKQSTYQQAETLETTKPIIENQEDIKAQQRRQEIISKFEKEQALENQSIESEDDFDLREAIIHQAILDRPYKD